MATAALLFIAKKHEGRPKQMKAPDQTAVHLVSILYIIGLIVLYFY